MPSEKVIQTDVLVIGGGMAGFFAAMKAREQGLDVTLTDKAFAGKSGSTHFSEGDIVYFRQDLGHDAKEWVDLISRNSEYLNNREWDEICLLEAEARYHDLVNWGVQFYEKDGKLYVFGTPKDTGVGTPGTAYTMIAQQNRKFAPTLRSRALEVGVRVMDRLMVSELLQQEGRVAGAVGFNTNSGDLYVLKAKATILATGASGLKGGAYPVYSYTGDGEIMAYKAGAALASKEFMYGVVYSRAEVEQRRKGGTVEISQNALDVSYRYPFAVGGDFSGWYNKPNLNSQGEPVVFPAWDAHQGKAPLYLDFSSASGWLMKDYLKRIGTPQADKIGLDIKRGMQIKWPSSRIMTHSIWNGSGVWATDKNCSVGIPGLYAAGNSCGTMASGAMYGGMGFASTHAMVTGARAAKAAAAYISENRKHAVSKEEVARARQEVCRPIERQGGFSPAWVTQALHGITIPYYFLDIKHATRLQAALSIVEFLREHIVPKLRAETPHEWRLAHETQNMVTIAEMRFRSSLFRTESRGNHFREDYPRRDDPNWLAWVKVKKAGEEMSLLKEPIPRAWWPDLSKPYEERYPRILPME
ncbi:MAG: FAD-binding protein [Burkholderiales bacterium]|nr:FAD-binding protein [Burkholderiales bacterium]